MGNPWRCPSTQMVGMPHLSQAIYTSKSGIMLGQHIMNSIQPYGSIVSGRQQESGWYGTGTNFGHVMGYTWLDRKATNNSGLYGTVECEELSNGIKYKTQDTGRTHRGENENCSP